MPVPPARVLLVFLDGVGLGGDDPDRNPFLRAGLPVLRRLLGGMPTLARGAGPHRCAVDCWWLAADACLGVDGKPQSGTGQVTLFTGTNAAALLGRHFGPWVHTALRPLLERENLLVRAADAGRRVAFANAYPAGALGFHGRSDRRPAAPPLAARAAGALTRGPDELRSGRAVASSITNEAWRTHLDPDIPSISARAAGQNLARIAAASELTLFAHYDTDAAGHRQEMDAAVRALERVDAFLEGLLETLPNDCLVAVSSDHGNLEDVATGHTRNPVPVVLFGPGSGDAAGSIGGIGDVAPALLRQLGIPA